MPRRGSRPSEPRDPPDAQAALEIAVRYLGTRPRTRWEVQRRLQRAGVEPAVVDAVVERLVALGYLDDAAFARWWGEQRDRHAPRGRRLVATELRAHGVPRDVIEAFVAQHDDPERLPGDEALPSSEHERARDALDRHLRGRALPTDPKGLQRLGMFLMRRGFDPATVRATIRAAGTDVPDTEEA
jgi:regulatory protein